MALQLKRGTRAKIDALALRGGLLEGEPLFITDEKRVAVALNSTNYNSVTYNTPIVFSAYMGSIVTSAANSIINGWVSIHNLGGGTFSGADTYTVPVTGWYKLHLSILADQSVAGGAGAGFRVNSTNRARLLYVQRPLGQYNMGTAEEYAFLNQGDQVRVVSLEANTWYGGDTPVGRWNVEYMYWQT